MKTIKEDVGARIHGIRKSLGFSLAEFGDTLCLGKTAVHQYEKGMTSPNFDVAIKIAKMGNVSLGWLIAGEGPSPGEHSNTNKTQTPYGGKQLTAHLSLVIEAVEEHLQNTEIRLSPTKKAELITLLCEMVQEEGAEKIDKTTVAKLIKLAS